MKNGYYKALYQLIEETYEMNNRTPVTIVAHSLGGPISHYFLSHLVGEDWKHTHIKQYVSLSGVFGGCVKALKALVSGSFENLYLANVHLLRDLTRSFPSVMLMVPYASLWNDNEVIVSSSLRSYTVRDIKALFNDSNYANGTRMYTELQNLMDDFSPPNVTHFCFYGKTFEQDTLERVSYGEKFEDEEKPHLQNGEGDGTVNIRSLRSCEKWKAKQIFEVHLQEFEGVSHFEMVSDDNVIESIKQLVLHK